MDGMTYGQIAYEAYRRCSGGKSLATGSPIPDWQELREEIQAAWEIAAYAVRQEEKRRQERPRGGQ